jgi:hypothetical protein
MNVQDGPARPPEANPVMTADRGRVVANHRLPAMPSDVTARIERALGAEAARRTALAALAEGAQPAAEPERARRLGGRRLRSAPEGRNQRAEAGSRPRLPADGAVQELADEVGMTVVPRVLLDHVQVDPAQR